MENYPSKLLANAVAEISRLPGVGRKSALRIALHLLKADLIDTQRLANAIIDLREQTIYCSQCHSISDTPVCSICSDTRRTSAVICVVEKTQNVLSVENTGQYKGLYHVLGGVISPIEGIGPEQLNIESLISRVKQNLTEEVIFALGATIDSDSTVFYLKKRISEIKPNIKLSAISRGIAIGTELDYTDEITLAKSIILRTAL